MMRIQSRVFYTFRRRRHLHSALPTRGADGAGLEGSAILTRLSDVSLGKDKPNFHLTIQSPSVAGGHALLGRNGSGKTGVLKCVANETPRSVEHVSFESHLELLEQGGSVYKALAQGNLNKAAQFLIVRFGLYPLLHQDVRTLSNGQIKKVLIVRALSHRPSLLLLDNAFDGLDVPSRDILKQLVSKTLQGFSRDILVQGVSATNTVHTQVLQVTQRAEEIVDEFGTLSFFDGNHELKTMDRNDMTSLQMIEKALDLESASMTIPTIYEIEQFWGTAQSPKDINGLLVSISDLSIERNGKRLLNELTWKVCTGQRWIVGGQNGAGKSTLSRLLVERNEDTSYQGGDFEAISSDLVGWVSTERHMALAHSDTNARDLFPTPESILAARWLGVDGVLDRPFSNISQGEQRLVLIASALGSRPKLLVLDEPCQGLDLIKRENVLRLIEIMCQATDMGLIYITHHFEEKIPSISHALHLEEGRVVYDGNIAMYAPDALQ